MQAIYSALCLPDLQFHAASAHFTEHIQSALITGFKSLPGLPGVKGLIAAYIWRNPNSSNSHPHRVCNFRTLSSGSGSNADDQYSQLKRFIVRDITDWANENHTISYDIIWTCQTFTLKCDSCGKQISEYIPFSTHYTWTVLYIK